MAEFVNGRLLMFKKDIDSDVTAGIIFRKSGTYDVHVEVEADGNITLTNIGGENDTKVARITDILNKMMALSRQRNVDISITLTSTEPGVEWHWIIEINLMRNGKIIKRIIDSDSVIFAADEPAEWLFDRMLRALYKEETGNDGVPNG